jgi:hypothetical protein
VTQEYADKMGADGYAATASATVQLAKNLMVSMGYDVTQGPAISAETEAAVSAMEGLMETWDRVESGQKAVEEAQSRSGV